MIEFEKCKGTKKTITDSMIPGLCRPKFTG